MKNNKGITMIELVVGMGILGVVSLMAVSLLAAALRMHRSTITNADLQTECQTVGKRVSTMVMNAADLYYDETEDGSCLFTGTITIGSESSVYTGPIIWFNKKTGSLYQNDTVSIEVTTGKGRPLTTELVKTALEGDAGTDSGEYLISDRVQKLELAISPRPVKLDALFCRVDGIPTFHYSVTAGFGEDDTYTASSSTMPRNRLGNLHFKGGKEIGTEEEIEEAGNGS